MPIFKKILNSNLAFGIFVAIFIIAMAFVACDRGGKDLKVFLFGAEQTLGKQSPYINPTDPNRTIFLYAPGFTILLYPFILKAKMVAPFEFTGIAPSVLLWYAVKIILLLLTLLILLKIVPGVSKQRSLRNLKLSILMSIPWIGYELSNSQNKLIALFFIVLAIWLFEKDKLLVSAISFCIALTIYVPLIFFALYFLIKKKFRFLISFFAAVIIVFFIVPSLAFGFKFNLFLLKDWFTHAIQPFSFAKSYAAYIDLRVSSQSLPSAVGRIFVSGNTEEGFKYFISPLAIHMIIRAASAIIILLSCLAVWKNSKQIHKPIGYAIFLILALILPQYCIYYTCAWFLVLYFIVFNYTDFPEVPVKEKKLMLGLVIFSFLTIFLIALPLAKHLSFIFWSTFILWSGLVTVILRINKVNLSKATT